MVWGEAGTSFWPVIHLASGDGAHSIRDSLLFGSLSPREQTCPGSEDKEKWEGRNSVEVEGLSEGGVQLGWGTEERPSAGGLWCVLG